MSSMTRRLFLGGTSLLLNVRVGSSLDVATRIPRDYKLLFEDHFEALSLRSGGADEGKLVNSQGWWTPRYQFLGDPRGLSFPANKEEQINIDPAFGWPAGYSPTGQLSVQHSNLRIRAERTPNVLQGLVPEDPVTGKPYRWVSGVVTTRHAASFGAPVWFEMCARVPKGPGVWAAFWALAQNTDEHREIDFMEFIGTRPSYSSAAAHVVDDQAKWHNVGSWADRRFGDLSADFHKYACLWLPEELIFFIDNREILRTVPHPLMRGVQVYLILSLSIGGTWPGSPNETTPDPADYLIDYVRVYGTSNTPRFVAPYVVAAWHPPRA